MVVLQRIGVVFLWVIGGFLTIFVGGFLLNTAGTIVTNVVLGLSVVFGFASRWIWNNKVVYCISWFVFLAAGLAHWLNHN